MDGLLADDVAVVTGGASGIGRSISLAFAESGADVVIADITRQPREGGTPTHELIRDLGRESSFVECDVTQKSQLESAVNAADDLGGLDVMVNNAGINIGARSNLSLAEEDFDRIMNVNAKGTFLGCQVAGEYMRAQESGSIINISSTGGIQPSGSSAAYGMSKGAIKILTYSLAAELGPQSVRVNVIHPGSILTELSRDLNIAESDEHNKYERTIALNRLGEPEEVANVALFLASDLASYVNGVSVIVDGGRTNIHSAQALQ